jgi:DNA excision repair protein ERCC-3
VLPCGAGKTLVGITAATTIHKSTLVFCTTGVAVDQWRRQFQHWTTLRSENIIIFTSAQKDTLKGDTMVLITTYNMVAFNGKKRSRGADAMMKHITTHEWGLVLLDEVHVAPAKMFRKCVSITHSRCKLGLTATLVREDALIEDLFFLIGPKVT